MADQPLCIAPNGRPIYDNTATVVVLLVPRSSSPKQLLVVRRKNNPGAGLLGLPGGYHMYGESWQMAGCREVWEETGYVLVPETVDLLSMVTDEYRNNLVFARVSCPMMRDTTIDWTEEVEEVLWLTDPGEPSEWAFPRHYQAAVEFFEGKPNMRMDARI